MGTLAKPGGSWKAATTDTIVQVPAGKCDCSYRKANGGLLGGGGCQVTKAAPKGLACRCKYMGAWTCKADTVICHSNLSEQCKTPGTDHKSCIEGGGDCG